MIKTNPLENALSDMKAQKDYGNYLRPRSRERLERRTRRDCRDLIILWTRMRKYDEDHNKYRKLESKAIVLIEKISKSLDRLSLYSPDWVIQYREQFETTL